MRHIHKMEEKKKKGPVGPGKKQQEEEPDKLETFFHQLYDFHNPESTAPVLVPAILPARYAIDFVPAVDSHVHASAYTSNSVPVSVPVSAYAYASNSAPVSDPVSAAVPTFSNSAPSTGYSVISSANFVISNSIPSTDYSVISSVNFAIPVISSSSSPSTSTSTCIETT